MDEEDLSDVAFQDNRFQQNSVGSGFPKNIQIVA
jgi:hypothetical protein